MSVRLVRAAARAVAVVFLVLVAASPAYAVTKTWTNNNGAGDGKWHTASNWSPAGVPTNLDDVEIGTNQSSNYCTLDGGNATAKSVSIINTHTNGPTLEIKNGSNLTIDSASSVGLGGTLLLNYGNVAGAGALTVSGNVNVNGGQLGGTGGITVNAGGVINFNATSNYTYLATSTTNNGTINFNTGAVYDFYFYISAVLTNNGLVDFKSDENLYTSGAGPFRIDNQSGGTVRKSGGAGTMTFYPILNNGGGGSVKSLSGTLALQSGGASAGDFEVSTGNVILISAGTYTFNAGATVSGAGKIQVQSILSIPSGADVTIPNLHLASSGTKLDGSGTLRISTLLQWDGGYMTGGGLTIITATASMNIACSVYWCYLDNRQLNVAIGATANYTPPTYSLYFYNGSSFNLNSTATLNIQTDQDFFHGGGALSSISNNGGTIQKTAGSGAASFGVPVSSSGTISVTSGDLQFATTTTITGGSISTGTTSNIDLTGGTFQFSSSTSVGGTGNFRLYNATLRIPSGVTQEIPRFQHLGSGGYVDGAGTLQLSGTSLWAAGYMGSSLATGGTTELKTGSILNITASGNYVYLDYDRTLLNNGTVNYSPSLYYLQLQNQADIVNNGTFDIQSDASINIGGSGPRTFTNNASLLKSAGTSAAGATLYIEVDNAAAGTVNVTSGRLNLHGGGTSSGTFNIGAGAFIQIINLYDFAGTPSVTGSGTLRVTSSGNMVVPSGVTLTVPNLAFDAGYISGAGTLRIGTSGTWSGGTMGHSTYPNGTTEVLAGASLALDGASNYMYLDQGRTLVNNNVVNYTAGGPYGLWMYTGSTLNNPGTINYNTNLGIGISGSSVAINNSGTILKATGTGAATISPPLHNTGTLQVDTGSLILAASGTHTGGDFIANGTGTIGFSAGTHALDATASLTGTGTVSVTGGTVTVAGSYSPARMTVSGGTLTLNSNGSTGILTFSSSGIINGTGTFTLTDNSTWTGGTFSGTGSTVVSPGKTLSIVATTNYCYVESRTLTNNGIIQYPPTASNYYIYVHNGGVLANAGTFEITNDQAVHGTSAGTINNSGTFTKTAGTGNTVVHPVFHNTGNVAVSSGAIAFNGNGTHTGSWTATSPGSIAFNGGTHTINGPGTISGTGTLAFTGATATVGTSYSVGTLKVTGGTATLNASGSGSTFEMTSGTLNGSGTVTANLGGTWSGGTMSGTGATVIPNSQILNITAATNYATLDGRTLTANGTINYTAGPSPGYYLQIYNGGTLNNNGVFNHESNQTIYGASNGTFNNAGSLNRSSATGTSSIVPTFNNSGSVTVASGTLNFSGNGTHTGTWTVTSPATLGFSGGTHTATAGSIGGTGTLAFTGATFTGSIPYSVGALTISGGTATMNANGGANAFTMTNGTLGGTGTLTLNNGGTWSGGTMTDAGTTVLPSLQSMTLSASTGYPVLVNGRVFNNNGTITYTGAGFAYLQIYNNATLNNAGTFTVTGGTYVYGTNTGVFNNSGTFNKSGGAHMDWDSVLNNTGQLTVGSGTLSMRNGGTHTNGVFTATSPGTIQFAGGTHALSGSGSMSGTGAYAVSNGTVNVAVPYTLTGLTLSNGTINFNVNGTIGVLSMSSGTIGGTGTVTVTENSSWSGGVMQGTGTTLFSAGKTVTLGGTNYLSIIDSRTVTNNGTFNYSAPTYYLQIYNNGVLNNAGTLNLQTDVYIWGSSGGTINNTGSILRNSGTSNTSQLYPIVNNNGTIGATVGNIELLGGGTHNGTFSATSPSVMQFGGGTHTVNPSGSLTGTGRYRFTSGTVTVDGTWSGIPIDITNGTLNLNPNGSAALLNLAGSGVLGGTGNVTVTGNSTWSGGTMQGTGTTTVDTGVTIQMPGNVNTTTLNRPLLNKGTITYAATTYYLQINNATVTNDGIFDVQTAQLIYAFGAAPSFINNGTYKKTAGTGTMQFYAPFTNNGLAQFGSGTSYLSSSYVQGSGTTELLNNATLQTTTVDINGGSLIGNGTIAGSVTSDGIVAPGSSAGKLTITGNYTQSATGVMNVELGGTTAGTQYDQVAVQGSVTLGGTLNVSLINGFFPASGNTFQILTFGSRPGTTDFATKNGLTLGQGTNLIPAYSATDLQLTTNTVQADLAIAMNATPSTVSNGGAFSWNITVTNNGGSNASGVTVTATLPANATFTGASPAICSGAPNLVCTIGTLPNAGTANLTINATANGSGTASMTANVSASQFDPNGANNSATAGPAIAANADLGVAVTDSPDPVAAGAAVTYTINVSNAGFDSATSVTLTVTPSAGLTFSSASAPCAGGFPCSLGNLGSGANSQITATYTVSPAATGTAQIVAAVSAASPVDPNAANDSDTETTTIAQDADVQVIKTGPANVSPEAGSTVTYNIAVTNNGPSAASGVSLDDPTPNGLTRTGVTGDCSTFPCAIGAMMVGQTKNVQVTYSISGATGTTFTNTATVTATTADSVPNNNSSSVTTTVGTCPSTSITAPGSVNGGSTGNGASVTAVSGATYNWSISNGTITGGQGTSAITFSAGPSGNVTLSVTVTAGACTSTPSAVVPIVSADLGVTITDSPDPVAAGAVVTYTIDVTNNGPGAASGVTLGVTKPAELTFSSASAPCAGGFPCALGSLASGATTQVTVSFTVSPSATGTVQVSANVSASSPSDPNAANNTAAQSTTIGQEADVQVIKTGPSNVPPESGSTVTYNIAVTNNGPSVASSVSLDDPTPQGLTLVSVSGDCSAFPCAIGSMTAGQTKSVQVVYQISGAVGTTYINTATVTSAADPNAQNNSSSVTTTVSNCPAVSITAPQSVNGGSSGNAASVTTISGASYSWSINNGTITSGQGTSSITFTAGTSGSVALSVTVSSGACVSSQSAVIPIFAADLAVTKTGPANVSPTSASTITYSISVGNNGPSAASGVILNDPTPSGLTFVSATGACTAFPCSLGTLNASQTASVQATYSFTAGSQQTVTNTASVSSSTSETNNANNSSSVTTVIAACPSISITAPAAMEPNTSGSASATAVANATYNWTISNGTITGGQGTSSITFTTAGAGTTTLGVTVTAGGCTGGANHSIAVTSTQADVGISKSSPSNVASGAQFTYTLSVSNNGPANADSVTASDALPNGVTFVSVDSPSCSGGQIVTCNLGTVAAGATTVVNITVNAPQGPITLTNTAQVSTTSADPNSVNNSSTITTTIGAPPVECPASGPTLNAPADGASVTSPVTFSWNAVQHATSYELWLGANGDNLTLQQTAGGTSATLTLSPGQYAWQVVAKGNQSCTARPSATRTFTIPAPVQCPANGPALNAPADGASVTSPVTFSWNAVQHATSYELWLGANAGSLTLQQTTAGTSATLTLSAGSYAWQVVAKGEQSCTAMPSATRTFTIPAPVECPASGPTLNAPADGTSVTSPVTFSWNAVQHATSYELWLGANAGNLALQQTTGGTSLTLALSPGQYAWQVVAKGTQSCTPMPSATRTFTIPAPVECPANGPTLNAPADGTSVTSPVTFSWNAVQHATSYELWLGANAGNLALQQTTGGTSATLTLSPGSYAWQVVAKGTQSCTAMPSATRTFTIPAPVECPASGPTLNAPADGASVTSPVTFSWNAVQHATSYELWLGANAGSLTLQQTTAGTSATLTLSAGSYAWQVVAKGTQSCTAMPSATRTFTIPAPVECPANGPTLNAPADGASVTSPVTFSWNAVQHATSYELWLGANAGSLTLQQTTAGTSATLTLSPGSYAWQVVAKGTQSCTAVPSATRTFTISAPVECPANGPTLNAPADGAAGVTSPVTFSWNAVQNATSYELWLGANAGSLTLQQTTAGTSATLTLSPGSYAWQVVAKGSQSCTAMPSATRTFTIPAPVECPASGPTLNAPADGAAGVTSPVTFSWSAVQNATSYELWLGANAGSLTLQQTTAGTSATLTLSAGSYAWQVVAKGSQSCTARPSATRTFTIPAPVECPAIIPSLNAPADGASVSSPVTFSWTLVLNAVSYELWLGPSPDNLSLHETTAGTALQVSLSSGTYAWQVIAKGEASCTPRASDIRTLTIPQVTNCGTNAAPAIVSPTGGTHAAPITFSWTDVDGEIGYAVRASVNGGDFTDVGSTGPNVTSLTASAGPGTMTWRVDALFNNCPPTSSGTATITVPQAAACEGTAQPLSPANNSTTTNAVVEFTWTSIASSTGYRVWLQSGTAAPEVIGQTLGTSLTRALAAGTYTFWIETLHQGCASRESPHFTFTIVPAQNCEGRGTPSLLSPPDGSTTSTGSVTIAWTAVTNALEYEVYLAFNAGVPTLIDTTPATSRTVDVVAGSYEVFVRAVFNGCPATESGHRTFTYEPPANCTANSRPVLIAPAEGERVGSPVTFDWNDVNGATGYDLIIDGEIAASTTASQATVQRPLGAGRWLVRAKFAQGCASLDSTESRFVVVPPVAACTPLDAPELSAPGQISSGVQARLQWSFVSGANSYTLQISSDPGFGAGTDTIDTGNSRQHHFALDNDGTEPLARYLRVRANDSRCNPLLNGPFSSTAILYILPEQGSEASALIGEEADVEYQLPLGAELAGQPFTATPTASWITVTPSSGTVPAGGMFLTVIAHTAGLPPGTNIGGVTITTGATGRIGTHGTTTTTPISINLVSPVTPTPKSTPPPDALVIPAVANADGIGSHFQSDVRVSNTSAQVMKYQLTFIPTGEAGITAGRQTTFSIEPGRTVALDDILKTWFGTGSTNAIGTLEVRPLTEVAKSTTSAPLGALANIVTFASSRTFNVTANGTFGQYIPAIPFANFIGKAADAAKPLVLSLQQISQSAKYRTNLGFVEGSGQPANLLVKVFSATGIKLTEFPVNLSGGQHTQLNSVLAQHGINDLDDGRVEVQVVGGTGKVTAYASVLDNKTADPLLVAPVTLSDAGNTKWVMPGVADLDNGAANWQTDMRVFNAGSTPEELTLSFHSMNGGEPKTAKVTLQPGEVRQFDRILLNTFGVSQNGGAIHITSADNARLIATSRTYNLTTQGTYGQFISAVTPAEAVGVGSRPLQLLQVEESQRYRSNIGFSEVTGKPVKLEVQIVPPDAKFTASVVVDLAPNEFRQLNSMLSALGLGETYNARISIRAIGGEGRATAYASVIDLETNDPTLIPAQ